MAIFNSFLLVHQRVQWGYVGYMWSVYVLGINYEYVRRSLSMLGNVGREEYVLGVSSTK